MAISQKGAGYDYREHIKDPHVKSALDDLASQIQAVRTQGQFGPKGAPQVPSPPSSLVVTVAGGIFTAAVIDANAGSGTRYRLQWATTPNFLAPIEEELATTSWQRQLTGQKLYFRVAAKFLTTSSSAWVYYGAVGNPTPLQG